MYTEPGDSPSTESTQAPGDTGSAPTAVMRIRQLAEIAHTNFVSHIDLSEQNSAVYRQALSTIQITGKPKSSVAPTSLETQSAMMARIGNDVAQQIADLKAAIQSFPQSRTARTGGDEGSISQVPTRPRPERAR